MKPMNRIAILRAVNPIRLAKLSLGVLVTCGTLLTFAQNSARTYKAATNPHSRNPAIRTSADKMPRSTPSSALPQVTGGSTRSSRDELNRLEQKGSLGTRSPAGHHTPGSARVPPHRANASKVQSQNRPINFSYQVPAKHPKTVANSTGQRH